MIPPEFELLIKKYKEGFLAPKMKYVFPNRNIDYEAFAEYWLKRKRAGTVRIYMSYLHLWIMPVNEQNITDWDGSIELVHENRCLCRDKVIKKSNGKEWRKQRVSFHRFKSQDYASNSIKRLSYFMYRAITMYLEVKGETYLIKLLPDTRKIIKPQHFEKHGYLIEEEFISYNGQYTGQIRILNILLFYTGARISELLLLKKSPDWIPSYSKDDKIKLKSGEAFVIKIPIGFAKTHQEQQLFLEKDAHIKEVVEYIESKKDNEYLFKLHEDTSRTKTYLDIEREKNVYESILSQGLQQAGLSKKIDVMSIHGMRRSYIHYIYETYGKDIKFASKLARHRTGVGLTSKYLELDEMETKERIQKHKMETGE